MAGGNQEIKGDEARQAIDSLGGYAYQLLASTLAWLKLQKGESVFLEVAEDYAIAAMDTLTGVQVKRTQSSITLNSAAVKQAIESFVELSNLNADRRVSLRYLTTAAEGKERKLDDRIEGIGGLTYWRRTKAISQVPQLRSRLLALGLNIDTVEYIQTRDDAALLDDLISRITWENDQPNYPDLRQSVEDAFVEYGSDDGLPTQVCANMAAGAIAHVLNISCQPGRRSLTFAEFRRLYERYATISVPISKLLSEQLNAAGGSEGSLALPNVLSDLDSAPLPPFVAPRQKLTTTIISGLTSSGCAWLSAGTGYGKSLLARRCASQLGGSWKIARLRSVERKQLSSTLQRVTTEVAVSSPGGVVLDDLEGISSPEIRDGISTLLAYCRRIGVSVIITANSKPTNELSSLFGLSPKDVLTISELLPEDIDEVVTAAGGEASLWSRYAEMVTGGGHPQLIHAFVFDVKERGWPISEIQGLNALLGQSTGLEATRASVRERLAGELEPSMRSLLYRLSVVLGSFDRALMFAVAGVDPRLANAGELLDRMIGPWIDQTAADTYRLSPLVNDSGQKVFSPAELREIHFACAEFLTTQDAIDASKFDSIFVHGRLGKNSAALVILAAISLRTSHQKLRRIAKVCTFASLGSDVPLYPDEPATSVQLRTVQLMMQLANGDATSGATWIALDRELDSSGADTSRLRALAISKMMLVSGTADRIADPVPLLSTLHDLLVDHDITYEMPARVEGGTAMAAVSMLFYFQMTEAETLEGSYKLLNGFCDLSPARRNIFTQAFANPDIDVSTAVKSAWAKAEKLPDFNAQSALTNYLALADRLVLADAPLLASAAFETAAATADEYLGDATRALDILDQATRTLGESLGIKRAKCRVLFRANRLPEFLAIAETVLADPAGDDVVGRAFLSRDIGIAKAKLGDLPGAAGAFATGRTSALSARHPHMGLMAIGFTADIAVVQWENGNRTEAVNTMAEALSGLEGVDLKRGFREVALYRLIGNSVNWFFMNVSRAAELAPEIESIAPPGCNSNPSPHEGLQDGPIGHMDVLWTILAGVEIDVGMERSIANRLAGWPMDRRLLTLWPMHTLKQWQAALRNQDVPALLELSDRMLDVSWFIRTGQEVFQKENLSAPQRGDIPRVGTENIGEARAYFEPDIVATGTNLFLTNRVDEGVDFLSRLATADRPALDEVVKVTILESRPPQSTGSLSVAECGGIIRQFALGQYIPTVEELLVIGIRLFEVSGQPSRSFIAPAALSWSARLWSSLVMVQSFRLRTPPIAVNAISGAIRELPPGRRGLATLLLAAIPFVAMRVDDATLSVLALAAGTAST